MNLEKLIEDRLQMSSNLIDAPAQKQLKIIEIQSGKVAKMNLHSMGLFINDYIVKLNNNKWGPVLVQNISNGSSKIALGHKLAQKIIVEYEDNLN